MSERESLTQQIAELELEIAREEGRLAALELKRELRAAQFEAVRKLRELLNSDDGDTAFDAARILLCEIMMQTNDEKPDDEQAEVEA